MNTCTSHVSAHPRKRSWKSLLGLMALGLLGMGQQAQAQVAGGLACDTGFAYGLRVLNPQRTGEPLNPARTEIYRINLSTGVVSTPYINLPNQPTWLGSGHGTNTGNAQYSNAFGLSADGKTAMMTSALVRTGTSIGTAFNVRRVNIETDTWTSVNVVAADVGTGSMARGAINPVNNIFYFSGRDPTSPPAHRQMPIYGYNLTTNQYLGKLGYVLADPPVPRPDDNFGNGDLTFDAAGNMYMVASSWTTTVIYRLASPTTPGNAQLPAVELFRFNQTAGGTPEQQMAGLSFDSDGYLYAVGSRIFKVHPTTGAIQPGYPIAMSMTGLSSLPYFVDTASCHLAPTLRLHKNVTRINSTDQFRLAVTPATAPANTVTTSGTTNGLQTAHVGHLPVVVGSTYTLTETQLNTAVLDNYNVTLTCNNAANGNAVVPVTAVTTTGTTRAYTVVIPPVPVSGTPPQVECTYVNAPPSTQIRLQKALPNGRVADTDQFTLSIAGTGAPAAVTTTGSGSTADGMVTHATATANTAYTLSEAAAGTTVLSNYTTTWSCTNTRPDGQTPSGDGASFSITPAANDDLTCTLTNTLKPRVTIRKISVGGTGSFSFSGDNGIADQTLVTAVAGTPVSGAVQFLTNAGVATTITEGAPPAGYALTDISCTGLGSGTATPDLGTRTVTLDAAATAAGANITCTFTNTYTPPSADLSITKSNNANGVIAGTQTTYDIVIGNNGPASVANAVLRDTPSAGLVDCQLATPACQVVNGTATCPAVGTAPGELSMDNLLGSGVPIPLLTMDSSIRVRMTCTVQ